MTKENQNILEDFYSGNKKDIQINVVDSNEQPFDLTNAEITYAIFTDKGVTVLQKSSAIGGGITVTPPATDGICVVHLLPTESININGSFRHHANVVDQYGNEFTVMTGKINIFKAYAQRYRTSSGHCYIAGV